MKWITESLRTLRKETNSKPSCGIGPARGHIQLQADTIIGKQPHMEQIPRKTGLFLHRACQRKRGENRDRNVVSISSSNLMQSNWQTPNYGQGLGGNESGMWSLSLSTSGVDAQLPHPPQKQRGDCAIRQELSC